MAAKLQVKKTPEGQFQFCVVGMNGRALATSATYRTKVSCLNGVAALRRAAAASEVEDQTTREWLAAAVASESPDGAEPDVAPASREEVAPPVKVKSKKDRSKRAKSNKTAPAKGSKRSR